MGRSGGREAALRRLLGAHGNTPPVSARLSTLPSDLRDGILELFAQLGGRGPLGATGPRSWDITLADGPVIELDERQHFTPYRAQTLAAPWAVGLPWSREYRQQCEEHADDPWKPTHLWRPKSAVPERLFGPAGPIGDYSGSGSPRGKQRALFDAIRDAHALAGAVTLIRLSIYDQVGTTNLGDALAVGAVDMAALHDLVARRTFTAR